MKIQKKYIFLIFLNLLAIFSGYNIQNFYLAENCELVVIANKTCIYKSIDFTTESLFDISDEESKLDPQNEKYNTINNLLFVSKHNDILTFVDEKIEVELTINSQVQKFYFYKIDITKYDTMYGTTFSLNNQQELEYNYGYVLTSATMPKDSESLKQYLDTNASVGDENTELFAFDYATGSYKQIGQLDAFAKIKLIEGYDEKSEYTKIQYQNSEMQIITCYVKTTTISVSRISIATICAIIIAIASVSIVLILLGIKNKSKKRINRIKKNIAN